MSTFPQECKELLAAMGEIRIRAMFGGHGLYADGPMFALIAEDQLYFKVDAVNRPEFELAGSSPFMYQSKGGAPVAMGYWLTPTYDEGEILKWARLGNEAAHRAVRKH